MAPLFNGKNGQKVLLLRPVVSVLGQGGREVLRPLSLTIAAILSHFAGLQSG